MLWQGKNWSVKLWSSKNLILYTAWFRLQCVIFLWIMEPMQLIWFVQSISFSAFNGSIFCSLWIANCMYIHKVEFIYRVSGKTNKMFKCWSLLTDRRTDRRTQSLHIKVKVKVKFTLKQATKAQKGRYSSTLSLTSALDEVGGQRQALAAFSPGKTRYPLYRRLGGSQGWTGRVRKISPPTAIRSPDRPARSQSLYSIF